jgi:hypothetical protein
LQKVFSTGFPQNHANLPVKFLLGKTKKLCELSTLNKKNFFQISVLMDINISLKINIVMMHEYSCKIRGVGQF